MTEEFFNNHACALEVMVKMIYEGKYTKGIPAKPREGGNQHHDDTV